MKMGYEIIRPEEENPVAWPIVLDKKTQDEEAVQGVIVKVEDFGILNKDEQYAIFIEAEAHKFARATGAHHRWPSICMLSKLLRQHRAFARQ
ncbi:hypothetical protein [Acetomicrobium sp.]|uniref:hypothetical protein n=1 Tax=Acetomicrobium sp. TaxID=1872099 RepID=UPI002871F4CE|nr:hypothetical protein [Acetomicrobium sp.]MDR9769416.1 hypothetical protein [Acetomicrobium sp.]